MTSDDISELEALLWDVDVGPSEDQWTALRNALPELLAMARENERLRKHADALVTERYDRGVMLDEHRAALLATRRALKLAQAKVWEAYGYSYTQRSIRFCDRPAHCKRALRAERLCNHYAAKFEREAGEL